VTFSVVRLQNNSKIVVVALWGKLQPPQPTVGPRCSRGCSFTQKRWKTLGETFSSMQTRKLVAKLFELTFQIFDN
jgi:hypothetical protein